MTLGLKFLLKNLIVELLVVTRSFLKKNSVEISDNKMSELKIIVRRGLIRKLFYYKCRLLQENIIT